MHEVYNVKNGFNGKAINSTYKNEWYHVINTSKYNDYVFLDYFLQRNLGIEPNDAKGKIHFVPGMVNRNEFSKMIGKGNTLGFFMPAIKKSIFINSVTGGALLPVKSTLDDAEIP